MSVETIKKALHRALSVLPRYDSCAFLGYPYSPNVGDHLVWLGAVSYLRDVLGAKIAYVSGCHNFSEARLRREAPDAPIFLMGGGNVGDLYPYYEDFRERIIAKHHDRPIIIFPQSIYFRHMKNLEKTAEIFNHHPDLTFFVRENESEKIARQFFHRCRIVKAPDISFQLAGSPDLRISSPKKNSILYLSRYGGPEFCGDFKTSALGLPQVTLRDWAGSGLTFRSFYALLHREGKGPYYNILSLMKRAGWSLWPRVEALRIGRKPLDDHSEGLLRQAVRQVGRYRLVITDRLHGHVLCALLGIPHVILPVAYYKNESFYQTWTSQLPLCRFVNDVSGVQAAVEDLLGTR